LFEVWVDTVLFFWVVETAFEQKLWLRRDEVTGFNSFKSCENKNIWWLVELAEEVFVFSPVVQNG